MVAESHNAETRPRSSMPLAGKLWLAGVALMVLASITAIVAAEIAGSGDGMMSTVAIGSIEGVERLGGIDIPEGAQLVNARLRASIIDQDPVAWAVIDMPRADARAMLARPPFTVSSTQNRLVSDEFGRFGGKQIGAWHPDGADEWLSAWIGEDRRKSWHVNALADLDEEPARVYLLLER